MTRFSLIGSALLAVLLLPGCDKGKALLDKLAKAKPAGSSESAASSGASVTELGAADFDAFTKRPGQVVVIDFHADWCGPCRKLGPILETIATGSGGRIALGKVNVDKAGELPAKMGVSGIPDVRIFRDGREVDRFVGLMPEAEVRRKIESHAAGLTPRSGDLPPASKQPVPQPANDPSSKDWLPPGMQRR